MIFRSANGTASGPLHELDWAVCASCFICGMKMAGMLAIRGSVVDVVFACPIEAGSEGVVIWCDCVVISQILDPDEY